MNKKRYIYLHDNILYLYQVDAGLKMSDRKLMNITIHVEDLCKCSDGSQAVLVITEALPDPDLLSPVSDDSKFADSDTYWVVKMVNLLGELAHLPPEAEMDEGQVNGLIGLVLDIIN